MNEIHTSQKISLAAIALYLHISNHFLRSFQIIVSKSHEYMKSYQFLTGEIIAPEDKSRSVKDPKILKTFRTYFFHCFITLKNIRLYLQHTVYMT